MLQTTAGTVGFDLVPPITSVGGSTLAAPVSAPVQTISYYPPGDVNRDGSFDINDVLALANASAGLAPLP
jgi:hypothetical protein